VDERSVPVAKRRTRSWTPRRRLNEAGSSVRHCGDLENLRKLDGTPTITPRADDSLAGPRGIVPRGHSWVEEFTRGMSRKMRRHKI